MVVKNRLKELQATSKYADAKYINLIEIIKQNENISEILEKAEIMIGRIKEYKKKWMISEKYIIIFFKNLLKKLEKICKKNRKLLQ